MTRDTRAREKDQDEDHARIGQTDVVSGNPPVPRRPPWQSFATRDQYCICGLSHNIPTCWTAYTCHGCGVIWRLVRGFWNFEPKAKAV